jgi:hypothetical protein
MGRGGNMKGDGAEVASPALTKNINKHGSDSETTSRSPKIV